MSTPRKEPKKLDPRTARDVEMVYAGMLLAADIVESMTRKAAPASGFISGRTVTETLRARAEAYSKEIRT
jgi:hypothetical protein